MRISEIFHSIQGEGRFTRTPSVFVRTTGCNLRCWFCDTPYASWKPEGFRISWKNLVERVRNFRCEHVVVTGGEPLLQPEIVPLTRALGDAGHFVTIETAGTVYRPVHADLISLSPKMANSTPEAGRWAARHEQLRDNRTVVRRFLDEYTCQLKFVVDQPADLREIREYLRNFDRISADCVWLMPQAVTRDDLEAKARWLKPEAERLGYRLSPRLHIQLYGNVRGK